MKSQGNCHKLCSPVHRGANPMAEIQIRSFTMSLRQYIHCIKPEIDIDQYNVFDFFLYKRVTFYLYIEIRQQSTHQAEGGSK